MASQAEENTRNPDKRAEERAEVVEAPAAETEAGAPAEAAEPPVAEPETPAAGSTQGTEAGEPAAAQTPEQQDDPQALREALQGARQAAEDNWNKLMRLQAEMENLRKRTHRDVENAHKYALEKFVSELLPVIDSLELGMNAADNAGSEDAASLREGMELTLKKLLDVFGKFGVEQIDPQGEKFNPELHEAVSIQESSEARSNTVITVMQKGYLLNGRLVRPAMVVVAK